MSTLQHRITSWLLLTATGSVMEQSTNPTEQSCLRNDDEEGGK